MGLIADGIRAVPITDRPTPGKPLTARSSLRSRERIWTSRSTPGTSTTRRPICEFSSMTGSSQARHCRSTTMAAGTSCASPLPRPQTAGSGSKAPVAGGGAGSIASITPTFQPPGAITRWLPCWATVSSRGPAAMVMIPRRSPWSARWAATSTPAVSAQPV